MAKIMIDIPDDELKIFKKNYMGGSDDIEYLFDNLLTYVLNGTPLEKALEDIKAEILQMNSIDYVEPASLDDVLNILDKHISGKE